MENINWTAYQEGFDAWQTYFESDWTVRPHNNYIPFTPEWKSWNKGWNANMAGVLAL